MHLTLLEKDVLKGIIERQYDITSFGIISPGICRYTEITNSTQIGGIVESLIRKGMLNHFIGDDNVIQLTPEGTAQYNLIKGN